MKWLSLFLTLASNTHVKSTLISLAGALGLSVSRSDGKFDTGRTWP